VPGTTLANIVWFCLAGIWLAIGHVISACVSIASCVLIIPLLLGAPAWALAHLKLAGVSLAPLGKRVVSKTMAEELHRRVANRELDAKGV